MRTSPAVDKEFIVPRRHAGLEKEKLKVQKLAFLFAIILTEKFTVYFKNKKVSAERDERMGS